MFSTKKRMAAFWMAVSCFITMTLGSAGNMVSAAINDTGCLMEGTAVAAAMKTAETATDSAVAATDSAVAATDSAVAATAPAFDTEDADYLGLSLLYSFAAPASQSALYYFDTTTQKAYYQVRAFVTSGSAFQIEIYDSSAVEVVGEAELQNGDYTRFTLEESQRYYLKITGSSYIAGSVIVSAVKDDFQDTRQMAGAISFNKEYAVNTDVAGDVDYLSFTIGSQDATYYLIIEPTAGSSGTYELQDSSGKAISGYSGTTNSSTVVRKKLTLTQQQTYYLKITSSEAYRQVVVSVTRTINQYKIYYHLKGGTNNSSNPSTYVATNTITLKKAKKKGYTFAGWYTSSKLTGKISRISGSAKKTYHLYAKWKKVSVKKATVKSFSSKKEKCATVKYKKVSGAKGYQIRIGLTKNLKKKSKSYKKKTTSVEFKHLKSGKRYYIKVRAYKTDSMGKRVYGTYSKTKSVKVYRKKVVKKNTKKTSTKKTTSKKSTKKTAAKTTTSKKK